MFNVYAEELVTQYLYAVCLGNASDSEGGGHRPDLLGIGYGSDGAGSEGAVAAREVSACISEFVATMCCYHGHTVGAEDMLAGCHDSFGNECSSDLCSGAGV